MTKRKHDKDYTAHLKYLNLHKKNTTFGLRNNSKKRDTLASMSRSRMVFSEQRRKITTDVNEDEYSSI